MADNSAAESLDAYLIRCEQEREQEAKRRAAGRLEEMVDHYGLLFVTEQLEEISKMQAESFRVNGRDKQMARLWDKAAAALNRAANTVCITLGNG